jgi:hypothetical protein
MERRKTRGATVSEPDFQSQMAALYRVSPRQSDANAFLAQMDAALDAHLRRRRWLLALLGMLGGGVTFAAFIRLEPSALLQRFFASTFDLLAAVTSMSWGMAATGVVIVLLLLPAFMRAVVDPKET